MDVKCCNCGKEEDINKMIEINTGRVYYLCWQCYKLGHGEAHSAEQTRKKRIEKYHNYKNRNK